MSLLNGESSNLSVSIEGGAYLMHDDYLRKHGNFYDKVLIDARLWFKINHATRGFKMHLSEVAVILFANAFTFDKKALENSLEYNVRLKWLLIQKNSSVATIIANCFS